MSESQSPVHKGYPVPEFTAGHGFPGFEPIKVVALDEQTLVSRHALSDEEVAEIVRTRQLYVLHPHACKRLPPVRVVAARPAFTLRVLAVALPGTQTAVLCHGLEVTEAEGSEGDRQDFVSAEAAGLVAAGAELPARVTLLDDGKPWLDFSGELCATRAVLEAAVARRLKEVFEKGGKRVEGRDAAGRAFVVTLAQKTPEECREAAAAVSVPG